MSAVATDSEPHLQFVEEKDIRREGIGVGNARARVDCLHEPRVFRCRGTCSPVVESSPVVERTVERSMYPARRNLTGPGIT